LEHQYDAQLRIISKTDTGATNVFSLYDFGNRTDVDVEKGYLMGIYGAIPFIRGDRDGGGVNE